MKEKIKLMIIAGPTAVGKTSASVSIDIADLTYGQYTVRMISSNGEVLDQKILLILGLLVTGIQITNRELSLFHRM